MTLDGLAAAVLAEPTLAGALADARDGIENALDLTGPAGAAALRGRAAWWTPAARCSR